MVIDAEGLPCRLEILRGPAKTFLLAGVQGDKQVIASVLFTGGLYLICSLQKEEIGSIPFLVPLFLPLCEHRSFEKQILRRQHL